MPGSTKRALVATRRQLFSSGLPVFETNELLYGHLGIATLANIGVAGTVGWLCYRVSNSWIAIAWMIAFWMIAVTRIVDWRHYIGCSTAYRRKHSERFYRHNCIGVLAAALMWAMVIPLFFSGLPPFERTTVSMLFAGMAAGASVTLGASPRLATILIGSLLLPFAVAALGSGDIDDRVVGALAFLFFSVMSLVTQKSHRALAQAIELSGKNEALMLEAIRQQKKVLALNTRLNRAKQSLVVMNQQLEEKVRRRTKMLQKEIDERETYRQRLERLASRDPLTGLANRSEFGRMLAESLASACQSGSRLAILFIDLDRFKEINDGLGHPVGDQVLKIVARRLLGSRQEPLCAARWGGDEFVMFHRVRDEDDDQSLEPYAQTIVDELSREMPIGGNNLRIGASIGIAVYPHHGTDPDTLIQHADMAVYEAKQSGRGRARLFETSWQQRAGDQHRMMQALKASLSQDDLAMFYQPIVDPRNGQVKGMEALMRWQHPEFGLVTPTEFIPLAEENGLMAQLGTWGLARACHDAMKIIGPFCQRIAVNVSVHQFAHGDFVSFLDDALAQSGLNPRNLELELTETIYARDPSRVLKALQAVRQRGVRIAIDDFGTGYSSLAYLQQFPVDVLKVDRSFVNDIDRGGDRIISTVASLARNLGVEVVAEGVETVEQLRKVRLLGADHVQGYLFARPMSLEDAIEWLQTHQARTLVSKETTNA